MARPAILFTEIKWEQQHDRLVELWKQHPNLMPTNAWERFATMLDTLTSKLAELGEVTYMPSLHH